MQSDRANDLLNPVPLTPLGMNGNGYVVIPKWFVSFLSFTVSVIFVGAILWAWQMSSDVSAIKAEVRAQNELRGAELEDIRRRLARHDDLIDRLQTSGFGLPERRESR
ncbi:hypothetical protein SH661x_004363 [Planctomicrobium sp. SH661]|uniref:hypothetical protein n=1 Tax=Planctomicrobium sp. SH661 TaxID=3448124 RepID=UPI003F5C4185